MRKLFAVLLVVLVCAGLAEAVVDSKKDVSQLIKEDIGTTVSITGRITMLGVTVDGNAVLFLKSVEDNDSLAYVIFPGEMMRWCEFVKGNPSSFWGITCKVVGFKDLSAGTRQWYLLFVGSRPEEWK